MICCVRRIPQVAAAANISGLAQEHFRALHIHNIIMQAGTHHQPKYNNIDPCQA
jgi:hypothetical protein